MNFDSKDAEAVAKIIAATCVLIVSIWKYAEK